MQYTDEITGIRGGVDKNGLPVGLMWEVRRTFRDAEGNRLGETRETVPLTKEELETHIAAGLTARDTDIASDQAQRTQERAAFAAAIEAKNADLAAKDAQLLANDNELAELRDLVAEATAGISV